ncbi:hypothetical protein IQ07DRAFT_10876 [Pyrenochaeta sp. DS3sAY3a]|nr:hypothetical protein IQ07DRAFT_10876 [Pyrenochaeta sp. DS3sAY3a]
MSTRRSARAKAPVKYTSESEGSDFGAKSKVAKGKGKVTTKKATPKKATPKGGKRALDTSAGEEEGGEEAPPPKRTKKELPTLAAEEAPAKAPTPTPPPKRTKKDPATLALELREKADKQEAKAQKLQSKATWSSWLSSHSASGALLDAEPDKSVSITQTDALKKYGLKKEELEPLRHFEKPNPNPLYKGTMRLFLEEEVRALAWRKEGVLAGVGGEDEDVLGKGEELWVAKYGDGVSGEKDGGWTEVVAEKEKKDASTPGKAQTTPKKK